MIWKRVGWTAWGIVPVLVVAFHFGPGVAHQKRENAYAVLAQAQSDQESALRLSADAADKALTSNNAWAKARQTKAPADQEAAKVAARVRDDAYERAASAWAGVAKRALEASAGLDTEAPQQNELALMIGRAQVRSGEVGAGTDRLERLLTSVGDTHALTPNIHEELATGYYYAARLMRLDGAAPDEWRPLSNKSRQHLRLLAESARAAGGDAERAQQNLELVLNFEQSNFEDLEAASNPIDCKCKGKSDCDSWFGKGKKPGNQKKPTKNQGPGAGFMPMGDGW